MSARAGLFAALFLAGCASVAPPAQPPLFDFQSDFWLNLHHFLRVVGRGQPVSAVMTEEERAAWNRAVEVYRTDYSRRDLLGDDMAEIKNALRQAAGGDSLAKVPLPDGLRKALEGAAPVYRRHFWEAHDGANREWIRHIAPYVERHGAKIASRVAAPLEASWPSAAIPIDLVPSAGPNHAYSTSPPVHVTIASLDGGFRDLPALEILFHESSHQWGRRVAVALNESAERRGTTIPRGLWHAVLFYNAGEITRRALEEDGVQYVDVATKGNFYADFCGAGCRGRIAPHWDAHLDGAITMNEALDRIASEF